MQPAVERKGNQPRGNLTQQQQGPKHPGNALTAVRGSFLLVVGWFVFFLGSFHEDRKNYFEAKRTERGYRLRIQGDASKKH